MTRRCARRRRRRVTHGQLTDAPATTARRNTVPQVFGGCGVTHRCAPPWLAAGSVTNTAIDLGELSIEGVEPEIA